MSDGRCRACGAAVPANAAWCSLCFADLRTPVPAPVREHATVTAPLAPVAPAPVMPSVAPQPVSVPPAPATVVPPAVTPPAAAVPVVDGEAVSLGGSSRPPAGPKPDPTWPCPQCGAAVPIELDMCNSCGAAFLSGAAGKVAVKLPMVGDVTRMSSSQRLFMALGVGFGLMVILIALLFLGGHVL